MQSLVLVMITTCVVLQALPPTAAQLLLKQFVWMVWDTFCLVCGGPPSGNLIGRSPALVRELGDYDAPELAWLGQHVGVQADGVVVEDIDYDNGGAYELPGGGNNLFHPFPSYDTNWGDPGLLEYMKDHVYGLACHMACYNFLHDKLDYKLQFEDVWPILELRSQPSECLQSDYGGITKYQDQVSTMYLHTLTSHTSLLCQCTSLSSCSLTFRCSGFHL